MTFQNYTRESLLATKGQASAAVIQVFLERSTADGLAYVRKQVGNPNLPLNPIPGDAGQVIIEECARYAPFVVNHDIVTGQVVHESAGLQSMIARDKHNYCGYGAENDDPYGKAMTFPDFRAGIAMQVRHLLGYMFGDGPWNATYKLSPRYFDKVKPAGWAGVVKMPWQLEQKWAWSKESVYQATAINERYGAKLAGYANELLDLARSLGGNSPVSDVPTQADIGFPVSVVWAADVGPARPLSSVKWFIIHDTEGGEAGDIPTLTRLDNNVASAHCWIGKSGKLVFMVRLNVTAWTPGNDVVAVMSVNVELEGYEWEERTEAQYQSCANFFRWCEKQGMNVPREFVAYDDRPGICGHMHVADPDHPGLWGGHSHHTDPGHLFDWNKLVNTINAGSVAPEPQPSTPPINPHLIEGFWVVDAIYDRWVALGNLVYPTLGKPVSGQFMAPVSNGDGTFTDRLVQIFERGTLAVYEPGTPFGAPADNPFHVVTLLSRDRQAVVEHGQSIGMVAADVE